MGGGPRHKAEKSKIDEWRDWPIDEMSGAELAALYYGACTHCRHGHDWPNCPVCHSIE